MITKAIKFCFLLAGCLVLLGNSTNGLYKLNRVITVRDGLPQSYVSGVFQDEKGFLWVSTLNGLGRYDGRQFKHHQQTATDTGGISGNIILHLLYTGNNEALLCYMDGRIDRFNTITGKVTHLWRNKAFEIFAGETNFFRTLVSNHKGYCWMMSGDGGVFEINLEKTSVRHFFVPASKGHEPVLGISTMNDSLLMLGKSSLFVYHTGDKRITVRPYPFGSIEMFKMAPDNVYSPGVRKNGDLIIADAGGIKIWNPASNIFQSVPFTRRYSPGKLTAEFDRSGNYYFELDTGIAVLGPDNSLLKWPREDRQAKGIPTSIYVDRSGVLWVGTNGFGLRQYNFSKAGLPGYENHRSFVRDVLIQAGIAPQLINRTFLSNSVPFANRTTTYKDAIWVADAYRYRSEPQLVLCKSGNVSVKTFRNAQSSKKELAHAILFLTTTKQGGLWAIDQKYQLLQFDEQGQTFRLFPAAVIGRGEEINGLVTDDGKSFYISTNKGLCRYNIMSGKTEVLTSFLPTKELMHIANDPVSPQTLWIGTLSYGMIRFDKETKQVTVFSTATGLPNNTIYSILPVTDSILWCSSNKGIFAFNKNNEQVRSFTSRDGLTDDEFNRYYYMKLPGGELAFGGPLGYTVFDPLQLANDTFDPQISVTDLTVMNLPAAGIANGDGILHLRYDQNFITAVFAAMEFDFPEKLQYRYRLDGLDKDWVLIGNDNKAAYTSLPPGEYMLQLNATNTAGKWSSNTTRIKISISPPFWKTWWFYVLISLAVTGMLYSFLKMRIISIKKAQAQELLFEKKAIELHAAALRAQMNPHFIFNCLNSIKALIQEKHNKEAVTYLTTFSVLIRRQLNNTRNEISLQDELETCKLYLKLEAMRFDDRISFDITVDEDEQLMQTPVPPLILQPIIENAIIHGLLPAENGGQVKIKVYRDDIYCVCEIEDNGIGRAAAQINKQNSSRLHQSEGIHLLQERITMHNRINPDTGSLETIDLFKPGGEPAGTLVIIKFNLSI